MNRSDILEGTVLYPFFNFTNTRFYIRLVFDDQHAKLYNCGNNSLTVLLNQWQCVFDRHGSELPADCNKR